MMQHKSSRAHVVVGALLLVLMLDVSAQASTFTAPKKLADYLYYMEYTDYVPDLTTGEQVKTGFACSAVRNGNFYGRNLDLDYSDVPEFVIKVAAKEGRYASIGMAAILTLKSGEIDKVSEAELLAMPNLTFDGINENGVAMNCNVCPASDLDFATLLSTNYGKPRIHAIAVVRYVLDHAKSAAHGVELLKNMDIYGGYGTWGLHWMLSDEKETYIIECIDGELVARNDTDNIMTNFYINYAPNTPYAKHIAQSGQTVAGKVYEGFPILTPHACGVERYAVLKEHYAEGAESAEGMSRLMERVKYTQAYEADTTPFWYTEFTEGNLTIANAPMDFRTVIQYSIDTYKLHDRDIQPNNFWQTWHTAVYDLANRTLRLNIQEDYTKHYDFRLSAGDSSGKAPDYSQAASWCKLPEITKDVDTFYIYATEYIMGSFKDGAPDYATLDNAEMLKGAEAEYLAHTTVFADSTNVFVPYYRQAGLRYAGEIHKKTGGIDAVLYGMPYDDITAALDYYFEKCNNGRPFIIAGHSQGSAMVLLLLRTYFKEHPDYYARMVAAYPIGYSVTKDYLVANPHLKFATGEADTGVIVAWNTEGPKNLETNANNVVVLPNTMSINPLNWKLDETYAPASLNLGSLVENEKGEAEIGDIGADAQINLERGVVVTNAKVPPMPEEAAKVAADFFGPDGRHDNDYTYYYNNIKDNVAKRIATYKASQTPDYSKSTSWYKIPAITKDIDTFFIYPTDYMASNEGDPDYAPLDNPEMLEGVKFDHLIMASAYEDSTNLFVPYYRQAGMKYAGEIGKKSGDPRIAFATTPYNDVTAALDYYFEKYNEGRPFIIAGHSQGSGIITIVLMRYFKEHPEYYARMVAAYVIGFSVTKDDLDANPHLKFAMGESDTGVIVSWNTEGPKNVEENVSNVALLSNAVSINPLNWKLDETYAPASENLGSLVLNKKTGMYEIGDIGADAQVVLNRGVILTHADSEPVWGAEFFGPQSFHNGDYTFYYNNIKANVAKRIAAYKASR